MEKRMYTFAFHLKAALQQEEEIPFAALQMGNPRPRVPSTPGALQKGAVYLGVESV
jgi:hypothetical protein